MLIGFVMACELFPAEGRTFAGMLIQVFWALGMCLMALFAWLARDWVYFQLIISLPWLLTIVFYWSVTQSHVLPSNLDRNEIS